LKVLELQGLSFRRRTNIFELVQFLSTTNHLQELSFHTCQFDAASTYMLQGALERNQTIRKLVFWHTMHWKEAGQDLQDIDDDEENDFLQTDSLSEEMIIPRQSKSSLGSAISQVLLHNPRIEDLTVKFFQFVGASLSQEILDFHQVLHVLQHKNRTLRRFSYGQSPNWHREHLAEVQLFQNLLCLAIPNMVSLECVQLYLPYVENKETLLQSIQQNNHLKQIQVFGSSFGEEYQQSLDGVGKRNQLLVTFPLVKGEQDAMDNEISHGTLSIGLYPALFRHTQKCQDSNSIVFRCLKLVDELS
jgi:hypothetical protein